MAINAADFKNTLAQFASGVTVVTAMHGAQPVGATVSSFTSVSLDPPLVLICLQKTIYSHEAVLTSGHFAVNMLTESQVELGLIFAGMRPEVIDRFDGLALRSGVTGSPILADCLTWLDCRVWQSYEGGDHTIIVGEVLAAGSHNPTQPLLYHNRQWATLRPLD
jgi:flavin reductase (DIM6/NTAB) family NADH-FMN oxidoreductase RutF